MTGLAARNGGRAGLLALVAILLLGLGLRLGEAWDGRSPVYDAAAYAAIAANLDRGEGFTVGPGATQPSSSYSPGLPLLAAGLYKASGGVHERLARVVLAVIGTLAVLFAYLIGRRLARPLDRPPPLGMVDDRGGASAVVAGLVAALAVAVYPALLEYQGMLMSEPLAATFLSGAVLGMFWAQDGQGLWRWLVPGLTLGALALVRPEYLGVGVLLAVVVFASGALLPFVAQRATKDNSGVGWRRGLGAAALLLVGMAVVILPWTVRNAVAFDRLVPVSTGGGQVLFAGTYLPSDGNPEKVGAGVVAENPRLFGPNATERLRLEQILARLAAATYPDLEADQALSKMGREQLWDDVSEEPLEYAGFLAAKVGRVWSHGPRAVMREPGWELFHWALVLLGGLGLLVLADPRGAFSSLCGRKAPRGRWEAAVLATVFLAITALSALLVASPRRVLVMLPLVAACAGVGAVWLAAALRGRRPSRPAPATAD